MYLEINFMLYRIYIFLLWFYFVGKVFFFDFVDIIDRGLFLFWFLYNSYIRNLLFYFYFFSKNFFII